MVFPIRALKPCMFVEESTLIDIPNPETSIP